MSSSLGASLVPPPDGQGRRWPLNDLSAGGFTGANIDRPAFQRLMADVEAGKVDVIVVYKVEERTALVEVRKSLTAQVANASTAASKLTEQVLRVEGGARELVEAKLRIEAARLDDAEGKRRALENDSEPRAG